MCYSVLKCVQCVKYAPHHARQAKKVADEREQVSSSSPVSFLDCLEQCNKATQEMDPYWRWIHLVGPPEGPDLTFKGFLKGD